MSQSTRIMQEQIFTGGIVAITLGKSACKTHVHKNLLQSRSPYFRRVLAYCGDKRMVKLTLKDVDMGTFCLFLSWLYSDCFTPTHDNEWMALCKLWVLAGRFECPILQNKVVEVLGCRLYQRDLGQLDLEILHYVYDNTGPRSKLRMLIVHVCMWYGNQDIFAQLRKEMPPVFYEDYAEQQTMKALDLVYEESIDPWNVTEFLLPEIAMADAEATKEVKKTEDLAEGADSSREERIITKKRKWDDWR